MIEKKVMGLVKNKFRFKVRVNREINHKSDVEIYENLNLTVVLVL